MSAGPVRVAVFGKTDRGRTRDHNEDTFLVADFSDGNATLIPHGQEHEVGSRGSLFMVADGMGGAAAGEIASAMAAEAIYRHLAATWAQDQDESPQRFAFRMREAVEQANSQLYGYAKEHPDVRGMGTTVTAAGVYGDHLFLTQIGDSRAYLIRRCRAIQLTRDQSLMQRLVDAGELTEEEAEQSERRNIILQALGPDPRVKVDLSSQQICRGDVLVICSDGLSSLVKRDEIAELAQRHANVADLCDALIDSANSRGGLDNITVVAARFDGEGLPEPDGIADPAYQVYTLPGSSDTPTEPVPAIQAIVPPAPPAPPAPTRGLSPLVGATMIFIVLALVALVIALWR